MEQSISSGRKVRDCVGIWIVVDCWNEVALVNHFGDATDEEIAIVQDIGVGMKVPYFWPRSEVEIAGRKVLRPIFFNYVSFCVSDVWQAEAIANHRFVRPNRNRLPGQPPWLCEKDQAKFILEMSVIEEKLSQDPTFGITDRIPAGTKCKIIAGPLQGKECIVEKFDEGEDQPIQVLIDFMGRKEVVCIVSQRSWLERI